MSEPMLKATGLRKTYGTTTALDGVDLEVKQGTIFALIGPNGAGKTTAVQILSTLIHPDEGRASIGGYDTDRDREQVRGLIGVTGQSVAVDDLLSGRENLTLMADLHHLARAETTRRVDELLNRLDLVEKADTLAAAYSGGLRRRLDLAMTLIGDPALIFLDEPTTGLDPRSRRTVWRIVRELAAEGVTIFLTTHYLEEADDLADHVAILDRGKVIVEGTPSELKARIPGSTISLVLPDAPAFAEAQLLFPSAFPNEEALTLQVPGRSGIAGVREVLAQVDAAGIAASDLTVRAPDLDDVFLALTGAPAEEVDRVDVA